jgi:hypothetical protein
MPKNTRRYFEELNKQLKGRAPGSPEFEALIRSKIGGPFQGVVSPKTVEASELIGPADEEYPFARWAGVNFPKEFPREKIARRLNQELGFFGQQVEQVSQLPEGKRIFGIGRHAGPDVWAHEYRHEQTGNEPKNRMYDVIYASTSLPAYKSNIDEAYIYLLTSSDDFKKLPFEEKQELLSVSLPDKESFVLNRIENYPYLLGGLEEAEGVPYSARLLGEIKGGFSGKSRTERNKELNATTRRTEDLPYDAVQLRAKFPFLNFVGKLAEPVKKAKGGSMRKDHSEFISKKLGKK